MTKYVTFGGFAQARFGGYPKMKRLAPRLGATSFPGPNVPS